MLRERESGMQALWLLRGNDVGRRGVIGSRGQRRNTRLFVDGRDHITARSRRGCIRHVRATAFPLQTEPEQQRAHGDDQQADGPAASPAIEYQTPSPRCCHCLCTPES